MANEKQNQRLNKRQKDENSYKVQNAKEKEKTRSRQVNTERKRGKIFKESVKHGRIYPCISCHRLLFQNGVYQFTIDDYDENFLSQIFDRETVEKMLTYATHVKIIF